MTKNRFCSVQYPFSTLLPVITSITDHPVRIFRLSVTNPVELANNLGQTSQNQHPSLNQWEVQVAGNEMQNISRISHARARIRNFA